MNPQVMRNERNRTRSTPYTIPTRVTPEEPMVSRHFEKEMHFTWKERVPHVPRPVAVVKPIVKGDSPPTVLQMVHMTPAPSLTRGGQMLPVEKRGMTTPERSFNRKTLGNLTPVL
ncbi:hypothetical protein NPIL_166691 [Nephila pilipes]|uniref:Uncharacterized protein n=1 Tax=Nephila pilipes TaxID=299642 RepID=A0A8X6UBY3_NEPPI|nr:hypothetical protein NPIL_166691 [Nephila pilipes]